MQDNFCTEIHGVSYSCKALLLEILTTDIAYSYLSLSNPFLNVCTLHRDSLFPGKVGGYSSQVHIHSSSLICVSQKVKGHIL